MLKNKILLGHCHAFIQDNHLDTLKESKQYEYFVNHCIVSKYHPEAFIDPTVLGNIDVDSGSTFGIDSISIIINGNLVISEHDVDIYVQSKHLDVQIVIIQTKSSEGYDTGDFLKFTKAVKLFMQGSISDVPEELKQSRSILDRIYESQNARYLTKDSPSLHMFFITGGSELESEHFKSIIENERTELSKLLLDVKGINVKAGGANFIIDSYNEIENRFEITISFRDSVSFLQIPEVDQSYIGFLDIDEFFKLIVDDEGNIRQNIFYENVRDFQGRENTVNQEINSTLSNVNERILFPLLNNGISIVASMLKPLGGNRFLISNFQIVNGCQTSNVLYHNRASLGKSNICIPVKIINSKNADVLGKIIRGTNRQSPVPDEAFLALTDFQKKLQEFYEFYSKDINDPLYYERRNKEFQFSDKGKVDRGRIITLHHQIRAYTAVMFGDPHVVHSSNPTNILHRSKTNNFFRQADSYYPYFTSCYIIFKYLSYVANEALDARYSWLRYFIGYVYRCIILNRITIDLNNRNKVELDCQKIISSFSDNNSSIRKFNESIQIVHGCFIAYKNVNGIRYDRDAYSRSGFTELLNRWVEKHFEKTK